MEQALRSLQKMQKANGSFISFIMNHNSKVATQDLKIA
jgi:hypothetical protein